MKYFENCKSIEELKKGIRAGTIANTIVPVLCGTSYKNKGVQKLLDAIVDYMPSPLDIPAIQGHEPGDPDVILERKPDDKEPLPRSLSR